MEVIGVLKKILYVIVLVVTILLVGACNNEASPAQEVASSQDSETKADKLDSSENRNAILSLGETGIYDTPVGVFDITIHSAQILESAGEVFPHNEVFILLDVTLTNNHSEVVNSIDILRSVIFSFEKTMNESIFHLQLNEKFQETVAPGESVKGQLLFDSFISESYEVIFGYGLPAEDLIWHFKADEAD
ncbi:DUF4352 domain-containing protein [Bacillus alkalicellulosilyticus]|uniref:DUF4352 domain-containing protein n=1 Tax=Alkalihalobacterium alkalicellulosilyticum TaxID=1912214 RepID=UPI0009965BA8|nr:DUF4352 domain-containing protein [Bacillus alkalicellulosilyticus]